MKQFLMHFSPRLYGFLRWTILWLKFGYAGRALNIARSINGFLTDQEALTLYKLTNRYLPIESPVVVEIGSWQGKSAVMLGAGLRNKHTPQLYCIDPFNGDGDSYSKNIYSNTLQDLNSSLLDIFLNNIKAAGLMPFTTPCPGYGYEWGERLSMPINLVFIDGNHEYSAVLADYELWEPKLVPGGIIAFHDVRGGHPGPQRVFEEKIRHPKWKDIRFSDSLAFAKKVE